MAEPEELTIYPGTFTFEHGVGLLIELAGSSAWLSWDETKELAAWLSERVGAVSDG